MLDSVLPSHHTQAAYEREAEAPLFWRLQLLKGTFEAVWPGERQRRVGVVVAGSLSPALSIDSDYALPAPG